MLKQLKDIYTDILRCMRSTHAVFAKDGAEVSRLVWMQSEGMKMGRDFFGQCPDRVNVD